MQTSTSKVDPEWKTQTIWVVALTLLAAIIRLWHVGHAAPWWDEMHSLVYVRNDAAHLIDFRRTTDIHPPLHFLSLKGWLDLFGETRDAARVFSVVIGTACVAMVFLIARQLFTFRIAILATLFIATFPTTVHYAREIRMYPLLTLFFLISFYFYVLLLQDAKSKTPATGRLIAGLAGFTLPRRCPYSRQTDSGLDNSLVTVSICKGAEPWH